MPNTSKPADSEAEHACRARQHTAQQGSRAEVIRGLKKTVEEVLAGHPELKATVAKGLAALRATAAAATGGGGGGGSGGGGGRAEKTRAASPPYPRL